MTEPTRLRALIEQWREEARQCRDAAKSHPQLEAVDLARLINTDFMLTECADELEAVLVQIGEGRQEQDQEDLARMDTQRTASTSRTVSDNEAIPIKCPCGLGDEPWHYPRGGACTVGMDMRLRWSNLT